MDLVSIILPFYKKEKYIDETINSILSQTYRKFEIILIYDETNLKNLKYLKNLFGKNKKIKIIVNKKNYGAGKSRNRGIKHSKGNFIAFIDADDIWKKNKLNHQIKFMKKYQIGASHTSYDIIDKKGSIISKRFAKTVGYKELLASCDIGLSSVIIKKSYIQNDCIFPELKTKEDYVLWLKLSKKGLKFHGMKKIYVKWRKLNNSLSSSTIRKLIDGYKVYKNYLNFSFLRSIIYLIRLSLNFLKKNGNTF